MPYASALYLLLQLLMFFFLEELYAFTATDNLHVTTRTMTTTATATTTEKLKYEKSYIQSRKCALQNSSHPQNNHASNLDTPHESGCPKIVTIHSADELFEFLKDDNRLCIIKYYASWCKSCAKFSFKFKQLAITHGDTYDSNDNLLSTGKMRFAQVEYGDNRMLCKALGINRLPFVQIYKASIGKVDEFVCGPRDFQEKVKKRVDDLLEMSDDEMKFQREMDEGQCMSDSLLSSLANRDIEKGEDAKSSTSV